MPDQISESYGETRGLLAAVMSSCSDAIIACSLDGRIEAWNRGAEGLFGWSRREAIGSSMTRVAPPERQEELRWLAQEAGAGRAVEHFDSIRQRSSGECFPAAVCAFPIRDDSATVVGYATILRDVSDRVRGAEALRNALSQAEEANAAKTRFLANISHELRTPMSVILGMTSLALDESPPPNLQGYLKTIRESAGAMLQLVDSVLDFSKLTSGRFDLDEVAFDLRELVESTVRGLVSAAQSKGIELTCRTAPSVPTRLLGDPVRLGQVLFHLIDNAVKFTSAGHVVVQVDHIDSDACRCRARFSVSDTGIGIAASDLLRIVAPFTQLDAANTRQHGGSGLGLSICRHLIDRFGGELRAESSPGEGSRFWFEIVLPLADAINDEGHPQAEELRGRSVLIIDADATSREALKAQLMAWRMHAALAVSSDDALEQLREADRHGDPFDLVIIGTSIAGADRSELLSWVQRDHPCAKMVLTTASADLQVSRNRYEGAGVAVVLHAPVSPTRLLIAVSEAMGVEARGSGVPDLPLAKPRKILLVEDTPANQKVVERILGRRGHHVATAANGQDAVDIFRRERFDVVLMDVQMPIMDGLAATEVIRSLEREEGRSPTRIIALTARTLRGDRERCLRAGMNDHMSKPLDLTRLICAVEQRRKPDHPCPAEGQVGVLGENQMAPFERSPDEGSGAAGANVAADLQAALLRLDGDQSLLRDMATFYIDDSPLLLQEIEEAQARDDADTLERTAHSLKGLASTFDAQRVVQLAFAIEKAASAGDTQATAPTIERLREACEELASFLSQQTGANGASF